MADQLARATADQRQQATLRAYAADWRDFVAWCAASPAHPTPLPASGETVAVYLQDLADSGAKLSTIRRRVTGISQVHEAARQPNPTRARPVRDTLRSLGRRLGPTSQGQLHQAPPVRLATLRLLLTAAASQPPAVAARDRALLLVGWACALRRSELGALSVDDVDDDGDGLRVTIRRSKTDPAGTGQILEVPYGQHPDTCPVRAWRAWLAFGLVEPGGPAFCGLDRWGHPANRGLSGSGVVVILRRLAALAGLDPAGVSGHSLRAGFISEAVRRGVPAQDVMRQSRHRSRVVFDGYVRSNRPMADSAAGKVGL